jgi:hypothetical protein
LEIQCSAAYRRPVDIADLDLKPHRRAALQRRLGLAGSNVIQRRQCLICRRVQRRFFRCRRYCAGSPKNLNRCLPVSAAGRESSRSLRHHLIHGAEAQLRHDTTELFGMKRLRLTKYFRLAINFLLSRGSCVALPCGQVFEVQTRIMTQNIVTSGAVANPNS